MVEGQIYQIEVYDGFWDALEAVAAAQQERITAFMAGHFSHQPRVMIPGQLKRLKGAHSHLHQLECGKDRLLYEIHEQPRRVVRIVYLGKHPEWEKRGKVNF